MYRLFTFLPQNDTVKISYNYSTGHAQGQTLTSPDNQFSYVNIPKNASSEFKFIFNGGNVDKNGILIVSEANSLNHVCTSVNVNVMIYYFIFRRFKKFLLIGGFWIQLD